MDLFPLNIALGQAFCDRVQERKLLREYIKQRRHTVIIAPRRYGKTSLINQVLLELKLPYCLMELTLATSAEDVEKIIIKHVEQLLHTILPRTIKAKQNILKLFKWLNPELVLTAAGQNLILHPEKTKLSTTENIAEILKKLDHAATMTKKHLIVVMDEFQQLNEIQNHTIEASIRHAMQYSRQISYIFSGSNRHMLMSMFTNKNRPFYQACEIQKLERISRNDYESFIQQAAREKWNKPLPPAVLEEIFQLSACHPSYVNRICWHFWLINQFPTITDIKQYWRDLVKSKYAEFTEDVLELSKNQKKVLAYLAGTPTSHPSSQEVSQAIQLSEPSIRQAIRALTLKDYIYKDKNGIIRVLDPAFEDFLKRL